MKPRRPRPRGPDSPKFAPHRRYRRLMAELHLQLDDGELEALRGVAAARGRSVNDIVREALYAVTSHVTREDKIRALTRRVMSEHAGLLKRLGEA